MSQRDIAKQFGYRSAQFVSNWERGISLPPMGSARKLAKTLQISGDEMMAMYRDEFGKKFERQLRKFL